MASVVGPLLLMLPVVWQAHTEEREPELDIVCEALAQGAPLCLQENSGAWKG